MASVGRVEEANKLVAEKLGPEYKVVAEEKKEEEKVSVTELFSPKYRRNTLVGGMFYACQEHLQEHGYVQECQEEAS